MSDNQKSVSIFYENYVIPLNCSIFAMVIDPLLAKKRTQRLAKKLSVQSVTEHASCQMVTIFVCTDLI